MKNGTRYENPANGGILCEAQAEANNRMMPKRKPHEAIVGCKEGGFLFF